MDGVCLPLGLGVLALLALFSAGAVVLLMLGTLIKYAAKKEPPDPGNYHLDQSHEPEQQ